MNYNYQVTTMNLTTTTITSSLLSGYQALRLNGELNPRALSSAEGQAIFDWVNAGGRLLADINFTSQVPAVSLFGVSTITGQNGGATGTSWYYHGAPMVDGPINGPLGGVVSFASACMDRPVLTSGSPLIVDYYKSGYPMIVHNQFGSGRVVIVFTNAWSHNQDWVTNAYQATVFNQNNLIFLQKAIQYLTFDVPSQHSVTASIVTNGNEICYDATESLNVAGNTAAFTVQSGGTATLISGGSILFLPGTMIQSGGYMLAYITTNGLYCGSLQSAIVSTDTSASPIEPAPDPFATNDFRLYPNPTSGMFTLEFSTDAGPQDCIIQVFSMGGNRILYQELHGVLKESFDLSSMQTGIYLVQIIRGEKAVSEKIIKH
jgi:hypothetical protein